MVPTLRHNSVHCLLLDLVKAFDSMPHNGLLLRLESLCVHVNLLLWFKLFLTKKYQRVEVSLNRSGVLMNYVKLSIIVISNYLLMM